MRVYRARDKYKDNIMRMESNNLKRTRGECDGVDCSEDKKDEHQVKKKAKMDNKIKNWGKIFLDIELRDQLLEHLKNEESVRKGFNNLYQCLNPPSHHEANDVEDDDDDDDDACITQDDQYKVIFTFIDVFIPLIHLFLEYNNSS